jgi:hypothetical protein
MERIIAFHNNIITYILVNVKWKIVQISWGVLSTLLPKVLETDSVMLCLLK